VKVLNIGERIKEERNKKGMRQTDLAKKANVSSQVVSNWERGYSSLDHDDVLKLSEVFNCTTDFLYGRSNSPKLTEEEDKKEAEDELKEIKEILEKTPEDERNEHLEKIKAYVRGLVDARDN
jgi:transcriptional regulator with XRE-family HTH domain